MIMVEAGCWIHGSLYYCLLLYVTKIAVQGKGGKSCEYKTDDQR